MPANPYDIFRDQLIDIHDTVVVNAFDNAATTLNAYGCDQTAFLELYFDGTKIVRIWDSTNVSSLPERERLRLYPQLNGLFKLAMNNKLYPA